MSEHSNVIIATSQDGLTQHASSESGQAPSAVSAPAAGSGEPGADVTPPPAPPAAMDRDVAPETKTEKAPSPSQDGQRRTEKKLGLASRAVHADDHISVHRAVAPPMHVSTTFRYNSDPDKLVPWDNIDPAAPLDSHMYSRDSGPNTTRLEAVLTSLLNGPAVTYSSGLAAFHALLVFLNPRRIAIGGGYHGCHGVIGVLSKLTGLEKIPLEEAEAKLQKGDVLHVETPLNPTGEARDLAHYAAVARRVGAVLTCDATFGPPPLQDPLALGVDVVMHSGTKYFGGHSDLLCGVLAVAPRHATGDAPETNWVLGLKNERMLLGSVMGSLEGWLGLRSLRTLELRVARQSRSAERLVAWLVGDLTSCTSGELLSAVVPKMVLKVQHASLQKEALADGWLQKQMPGGFGPVFALWLRDEADARRLPSKLRLFHHATSLGGVESLIEWRAMTDKTVDKRLLRVSVGVEDWEDLRDDLAQGLVALAEEKKGGEARKEGMA